jgi:hypothetical protein
MPEAQIVNRLPSGRSAELTITHEWINVETAITPRERDPDWVYVDSHGHEHRWPTGRKRATWEEVEISRWWCYECHDEHVDYETRCRKCGDPVKPGMRDVANPVREVPGLTTGWLKVTTYEDANYAIRRAYLLRKEEIDALTWPKGVTDAWVDLVAAREPEMVEPLFNL